MTITDWSAAGADQVATLYAEESRRWLAAYDWDTTAQWHEVEQARTRWNLPGLIAHDAQGRPSGWLYYLPSPDGAQLGGISAEDPRTAQALVEAFATREAGRRITGFLPDLTPGVEDALARCGLSTTPHLYLVAPIATSAPAPAADDNSSGESGGADAPGAPAVSRGQVPGLASLPASAEGVIRSWIRGDEGVAADVLRDAYDSAAATLFAPHGAPEEWTAYVRNLVEQIGCGRFIPEASLILEASGTPVGCVVVTRLNDRMAHIAQIGIRRGRHGSGEGSQLLAAAMAAARSAGATSISLLVSSRNERALRFYARHGFAERGRFVEAGLARATADAHQHTPIRPRARLRAAARA
ncbi:MAG: GNAT family N-acetyltransferase [Vicinamibacterales bacterium]